LSESSASVYCRCFAGTRVHPWPPLPFPMRSEPGVGKPDGPSRLAGSNLLPPVPRSFW
jgi:hypothetical protein